MARLRVGAITGVGTPGRSKYGAKKKTIDGIRFDSTAEAEYYLVLKSRQQAGDITRLILQPRYELQPRTILPDRNTVINPIDYIADFEVTYPDGHIEVLDVKGKETETYRIKAKMFQARYPDLILKAIKKNGKGWDD